ncbi:MAG: CAP domain-containing protein [Ilumatobacteraceae bacterium]
MGRGVAAASIMLSVTLSVGSLSSTANAAKSGGKCKNSGETVVKKRVTYRCEKVDESFNWVVVQRQSDTQNTGSTSLVGDMISMVNQERKAAGLKKVIECLALDQSAVSHSQDMYTRDFFDHTNPDGKTASDRIRLTGYMGNAKSRWTGENIAKGFADVATVMKAWMNSPGHRANILNPIWTHLGIGFVSTGPDSIYDGYIWTQDFGSGGVC